mmetsp:Transcript_29873/g.57581  ORF Transcript_29873/g.57581 Transcript_29873/m.57581 type:complete len:91 (+) Transcript_29873:2-274(+)
MLRASSAGGASDKVRLKREKVEAERIQAFRDKINNSLAERLKKNKVQAARERLPTPPSSDTDPSEDSEAERRRNRLSAFKRRKHGKSLFF